MVDHSDSGQELRYRALDETVSRLYEERRHTEALAVLAREAPGLPQRRADTAHLAACLLAAEGQPAEALQALSEALAEGAWWSPSILTEDDDLAGLRALPGFDALVRESAARHAAANGVPLPPVVQRPRSAPRGVLVALHGADQDAAQAAREWATATDAGFVLVAVDSSQRSTPRYRSWPDSALALRDIRGALTDLDEADGELPLIAAGFSAGGRVAVLWATSEVSVRPSGFLAVGPALTPRHLGPARTGVRGRILLGESDEEVRPGALDAYESLAAAGADIVMETVPRLGHALPPDLPARLPSLLDGLLGTSRGEHGTGAPGPRP